MDISRKVSSFLLLAFVTACGPEFTEPADFDVSGRWVSPVTVAGMSNFQFTIVQAREGTFTGTWSALIQPGDPGCAESPDFGIPAQCQPCPASAKGPCPIGEEIGGANTVLQVFVDLKGLGRFEGQRITGERLRGVVIRGFTTTLVDMVKGQASSTI